MQLDLVMKNCRKNGMVPHLVATREEVIPLLKGLIPVGGTVAAGGSVTLNECGVLDYLRGGNYTFFDRYADGLTPSQREDIVRKSYSCDAYFCSCNAITEKGELYNVDGRGNRISSIIFGPKKVLMVAGVNKIVKDINEAVLRVKKIAAPKNTQRLGAKTYCHAKGQCVSLLKKDSGMTDGCSSKERICCNYLVSGKQLEPGRIQLILVEEELGF